jgi:hypothetical protein
MTPDDFRWQPGDQLYRIDHIPGLYGPAVGAISVVVAVSQGGVARLANGATVWPDGDERGGGRLAGRYQRLTADDEPEIRRRHRDDTRAVDRYMKQIATNRTTR